MFLSFKLFQGNTVSIGIFKNLFLHWSAALYYFQIYLMSFICLRYYCFAHSVTPKTSVFQIQVHISLTEHGWIVNICGVSSAKPVPHHVPELLYITRCVSASKELCHHTRFAFLCTNVINISFYIEKLLAATICTELWFYHRDTKK